LFSYLVIDDALDDWSGFGCYASGGFMIYNGFFGDKTTGFSFICIVACGVRLGFKLS